MYSRGPNVRRTTHHPYEYAMAYSDREDDMSSGMSHTNGKTTGPGNQWMLYVLAAIGVIVGIVIWQAVKYALREHSPAQTPVKIRLPAHTREALSRAAPHMDWADARLRQAIDEHLAALNEYFQEIKKRTPAFADDVLGWGSKWRFVADRLPFTRSDRLDTYLRECFEARLFTPGQLTQAVEAVVRGYLASVQSTESAMLVRIRADIADLPAASLPAFANQAALQAAFAQALRDAAAGVQAETISAILREVASTVACEVLGQVATRLAVSAGILGTGAASAGATLGIGLAAGIVVDLIIGKIWDWLADPAGDLARTINARLDEIHKLLVDGDGRNPALRQHLLELHEKRRQLRRQAVMALIEGSVQS